MAFGYIVGAALGAITASSAKAKESKRRNAVRRESTQGILDLQPLYGEYRQQAAIAAGMRFDQVGLQTDQAMAGVNQEMSGYARTGFANFDNPALAAPTARLNAAQQGAVLDSTDSIIRQDQLRKQGVM